jgi:hypothetical protein
MARFKWQFDVFRSSFRPRPALVYSKGSKRIFRNFVQNKGLEFMNAELYTPLCIVPVQDQKIDHIPMQIFDYS